MTWCYPQGAPGEKAFALEAKHTSVKIYERANDRTSPALVITFGECKVPHQSWPCQAEPGKH